MLRHQYLVTFRRQGTLTYDRTEDAAVDFSLDLAGRSKKTSFSATASDSTTCRAGF